MLLKESLKQVLAIFGKNWQNMSNKAVVNLNLNSMSLKPWEQLFPPKSRIEKTLESH